MGDKYENWRQDKENDENGAMAVICTLLINTN